MTIKENTSQAKTILKKILKIVGNALFYAALIFVLAFLLSGLISRLKGKDTVDFLGYSFYVVATPSMETVHPSNAEFLKGRESERIKVGDLVVTKKIKAGENIEIYDVVTYFDEDKKATVIHRVYEKEKIESGFLYTTRGDGNNASDYKKRTVDSFTGKLALNLGALGKAIRFLKSPYIYMAIGGCGFIIFTMLLIFELTKKKEETP